MQQPPLNGGQITRAEYEARHAALTAQVAQNDARWFAEQAAMKGDIERKFDKLLAAIEGLRKEFVTQESLRQQLEPLKDDIKEIKQSLLSRQELFALRLAGVAAAIATLVAIFDLLLKFRPL